MGIAKDTKKSEFCVGKREMYYCEISGLAAFGIPVTWGQDIYGVSIHPNRHSLTIFYPGAAHTSHRHWNYHSKVFLNLFVLWLGAIISDLKLP